MSRTRRPLPSTRSPVKAKQPDFSRSGRSCHRPANPQLVWFKPLRGRWQVWQFLGNTPCQQQVLRGGGQLAYRGLTHYADLAQLVEHLICNQGVTGSSPVIGTSLFNGLVPIALSTILAWGTLRGTQISPQAPRHEAVLALRFRRFQNFRVSER
jgi:hypothetical protein